MDLRETNRRVIEQFRAGAPIEGMNRDRLLLLTTTGRHGNAERTTPMMFDRIDGALVDVASNVGAARHPDRHLNVQANPNVVVEIGDERNAAEARTVRGAHREAIWRTLVDRFPFSAEHQAKTSREIPLVQLAR